MITISKRLSKIIREDGMSEVLVTPIAATPFPSDIHTNIFVHPTYFRHGSIYPTKRIRNSDKSQAEHARTARTELNKFCRLLYNIVRVTEDKVTSISEDMIIRIIKAREEGIITGKGGWLDTTSVLSCLSLSSDNSSYSHHRKIYDFFIEYAMTTEAAEHDYEVFDVYTRRLIRFELYMQQVEGVKDYGLCIDSMKDEDVKKLQHYARHEYEVFQEHAELMEHINETVDKILPRQVKSKICKPSGQSDITMLSKMNTIFNWLINVKHEILANPFHGIEIGKHVAHKKPIVLNHKEIDILMTSDLSDKPALASLRDIFVFQCRTGIRLRDIVSLTYKDNIKRDGILEYKAKTVKYESFPAPERIALDDVCLAIIRRNRGISMSSPIFRSVSSQSYGPMLKKVFLYCGLVRGVQTRMPHSKRYRWVPLCDCTSAELALRTYFFHTHPDQAPTDIQDGEKRRKRPTSSDNSNSL